MQKHHINTLDTDKIYRVYIKVNAVAVAKMHAEPFGEGAFIGNRLSEIPALATACLHLPVDEICRRKSRKIGKTCFSV